MRITALLETLWSCQYRIHILAASASMVVAIALADWWTPSYVSLGFLYLFPIMFAAGFLSRSALLVLGVLCAVLTEMFSSLDPAWRVSRMIFVTSAFTGCGLFISELVRNRRFSIETQQRLCALVETSPAAIVIVDQRGVIELANRAASEMLLPIETELIGRPIARYLPELEYAFRAAEQARLRTCMQCQVRRGDGETFVADVWVSIYREKDALKMAAIIADVTEEQPASIPSNTAGAGSGDGLNLNSRQEAVLRLVLEGLTNSEIASRLDMTASAVKNTVQQLFSKAGVNNRSQMVRVALERYRDVI